MDIAAYITIALAAMKVFELVARLTPTTKDDNIVQWIRKAAAVLGVAVPDIKK